MTETRSRAATVVLGFLTRFQGLAGLAVVFVLAVAFSPVRGGERLFLSTTNLTNIVMQNSFVGILAVGMTLVILSGGIDLSVGAMMGFGMTLVGYGLQRFTPSLQAVYLGFCLLGLLAALGRRGSATRSVLMVMWLLAAGAVAVGARAGGYAGPLRLGAWAFASVAVATGVASMIPALRARGWGLRTFAGAAAAAAVGFVLAAAEHYPPWGRIFLSLALTVAACSFLGSLNGLMITRLQLQPFIATLAMMTAALGFARYFSNNVRVDFGFSEGDPVVAFIDLASRKEVMIGLFLATVAGAAFVLHRLPLGRHIYAIGGNEHAAWLAGIPVARVKMIVYTSTGMLVGLAGIIFCARNRQGNPNEGFGYELDAIAAVVVGGTRLTGGQGSVVGTLIGVLILGVIVNIMGLNNVPSTIQQILKGAIIVGAVWLQQKGTVLAGRAGSRRRIESK